MKLLILSDSHGCDGEILEAIEREGDADAVYFLGDGCEDFNVAKYYYEGKHTFICVKGNIMKDDYALCPIEDIRRLGGKTILAVHGNRQDVKFGLHSLSEYAQKHPRGIDIVLFGHTHFPESANINGIHYFNPGSIREDCYGTVTITDKGVVFTHKKLGCS